MGKPQNLGQGREARLARDVLVRRGAEAEGLVQVVHGAVERLHELVLQRRHVRQVPPPPALLHAAVVAWPQMDGVEFVRVLLVPVRNGQIYLLALGLLEQ